MTDPHHPRTVQPVDADVDLHVPAQRAELTGAPAAAARDAYLGPGDAEQVSREDLLRRARAGEVVILDVRPAEEYAAGHIPGAVSIPLDELDHRLAELPADAEIVAYCRGAFCVLAHDAVRLLTTRGRSAARLTEGMLEWRLADLPVTSGATA
jgi:rhodanese-related sulfurtransferase